MFSDFVYGFSDRIKYKTGGNLMLNSFLFGNFFVKWSWEALEANVWKKWDKNDFFQKLSFFNDISRQWLEVRQICIETIL